MTRLATLAGVVALFAPVLAFAADPPVDPLVAEVRKLRDEVTELRRLRDVDAKINAADMKLLHERLDRIEKGMDRLAERAGDRTPSTTSRFLRDSDRARGTLLLDNRLGVNAYVTIDGVSYSVAPLSTRSVRVPAGSVGYTLTADGFGVRPLVRTPLAAGETVTLTIY